MFQSGPSVRRFRMAGSYLAVALCLGAAPLYAQTSQTAEARPSDVSSADRSVAEVTSGRTPPAAPDGSDLTAQTVQVRANIELWESRVHKKLAQVEQILTTFDLKQIQSQKIAVTQLLEVLDDLDDEARSIIEAHSMIGPDLKLYRQALLQAPDVFRQLADRLDHRAAERKSSILKEASADFANESRKLAIAYENKAKGVDTLEVDLRKQMEFVHESREFIADVRDLLIAIPTEHGLQTEKLVARINGYIAVFQRTIDAMKGVTDKIGAPQESNSPGGGKPGSVRKSAPLSLRATPLTPISSEEYRRQLSLLTR